MDFPRYSKYTIVHTVGSRISSFYNNIRFEDRQGLSTFAVVTIKFNNDYFHLYYENDTSKT